ncbi:MAG TPA: thioredoxin domain-containing protein [Balneolaceae bacterium]|nr:thioredoxin domain-containing protein [Balneolaceae bacterium]
MKKLLTLTLTAILFVGISAVGKAQDSTSTKNKGKKITIVEYYDYECPACGYYYPFVKKLMKNYGDQINLKLHFYPLTSHQYGALAARAAQSAKNQGKFHEMHDMLFENQDRWAHSGNPTPIFINYARKLGLNIQEFKNDLNAAKTQKTVMESKQEGIRRGVHSTPTFFIEGDMLQPLPQTYKGFEQAVKSYLNEDAKG